MNNKFYVIKLSLFLCGILSVQVCFAQAVNEEPPAPASLKESGGKSIVHKLMQPTEKKAYLKSKIDLKDEYFRLEGVPADLSMAEDLKEVPGFTTEAGAAYQDLIVKVGRRGYRFIGFLKEDQYRDTLVFEDENRDSIIFTVFRFEEAGAVITLYDDFVTRKVGNDPAALSLTVVPGRTKVLWKFSTWRKGVAYEVYVNDGVSADGEAIRKPKDVHAIGEFFAKAGKD